MVIGLGQRRTMPGKPATALAIGLNDLFIGLFLLRLDPGEKSGT
jgi:hypothetical protein